MTVDKSAYDILFGMNALFGAAFILYKNKSFSLPLAAGLHYYVLFSSVGNRGSIAHEIGLGANISGEYHFNKKLYIYGRVQLSMDFYAFGDAGSGSLFTLGINPCLGLGFQM